ncbi:CGNR zinc finger domain-containing protein [Gorillibacterium sp. sgz5001074]|uniref:CGNR zinc finger domain-containing protein n=1 Tax=Gorillibacterium sp. sgz5001074 TaxID=3446695 RepID=UPI003F66CF3F
MSLDALQDKIYIRVGGALCLDFCNTVGWRLRDVTYELMGTPVRLIGWAWQTGVLSDEEAEAALAEAAQRSEAAEMACTEAAAFRETLFRILLARSEGRPAAPADTAALNRRLAEAAALRRLVPASAAADADATAGPAYRWAWAPLADAAGQESRRPGPAGAAAAAGPALRLAAWAQRILAAVAVSAAELLTAPEPPPVRMCGGEGCGWLFLDETRNRKRRWCSMSDCGNRAKQRRHYAKKAHEAGESS